MCTLGNLGCSTGSANHPCVSLSCVLARGLGLFDRCAQLADDAGIVGPDDFLLFEEKELVQTHKFKVGQ